MKTAKDHTDKAIVTPTEPIREEWVYRHVGGVGDEWESGYYTPPYFVELKYVIDAEGRLFEFSASSPTDYEPDTTTVDPELIVPDSEEYQWALELRDEPLSSWASLSSGVYL